MLNRIIEFSVKQKLIIILFTIGLVAYGSYELTQLPIDAVPDITNNQVQIITSAPSLGATDIERLVTFPVEQENSNIPGLSEIRSFSRFGLSVVTLVFGDDVDVYWARQQVQERLQNVKDQIPAGIEAPKMGPITTGLGEIYQYIVKAKEGYESRYSDTELRTIQDWIIRRDLLRVDGVADVSSFGGKLKQYQVEIDPNKLNAHNITINDVLNALNQNNQNTGGAYIEKKSSVLFIRTEGLINQKEEIENIAIKSIDFGTPLKIKDVAKVSFGHAIRYGALTCDGEGEVAGAIVMMMKGGNSSKVIQDVKEKIVEISKTLPEGIVIEPFLDRTKMVNNAIGTVETNLFEGALIVIFVLVLFLGNLRAGLLVASVIPLSMLFAVILMNMFGVSGNLMSLGALDFGLIIDGAVIIVEATLHQITHSKKFKQMTPFSQSEMDETVKSSASKMMNSAVFGQIIILVVYLPIFSLQGIEGKMFKPMAQTVAFALLGAFILSLTYVPMMSSLVLSKKNKNKVTFSDKMIHKIERFYQNYLSKALRKPKLIISVVIGLFLASLVVLTSLGGEFIPALEEGDFAVETRVLTGTSLKGSLEACLKAEKVLLEKFPEVIKVVAKTGSGEIPTDPMPIEASDLMIILKDKKEWTSAKTFNELAEKMGKELEVIPGVTFGFQYPVQMRFNELMTGARQDIVCKIFGEDLDTLASYANKIGKVVQTIDGAEDLYIEAVTGMPQIVINYNRQEIAQYNVSIEQVNQVVNAAFSGQSAGLIYEGEKRFDLVVRMANDKKSDINDVRNLLIPTNNGTQVPLYVLADVKMIMGPNQIQRENAKRRIVVGFNARGRDVQSLMEELNQKVDKKVKLPAGYSIHYGGSFKNLEEAKSRLAIAVPVALLLIFILLYFAFKSVKQGLLIFTAIPLSAIGGVFALYFRDLPFSISAGVGFIALFGVAVLNGIVLIAEFNRLEKSGMKDLNRIVLMGTKIRMRPVLMTAFVASFGFLPMALSNGAGAEVQRPLASVVIGGLLLATFLTLFVLPILYMLSNQKRMKNDAEVLFKGLILLVGIGLGSSTFAQTEISLEDATQRALKNNLEIQKVGAVSNYFETTKDAVSLFSTTEITGAYGQLNSFYKDNSLGLNQAIVSPFVFKATKQIANDQFEIAQLNVKATELEVKRQVQQSYNRLNLLYNKQLLLKSLDSIYQDYKVKITLRYESGETNLMEKLLIDNQLINLNSQLNTINSEIQAESAIFQNLVNSKEPLKPMVTYLKLKSESIVPSNHVLVSIATLENSLTKNNLALEKANRLPSINLSVNSTTMYGFGNNDLFYDFKTRFTSAQLGVNIELFSKQTKKIKSQEFLVQSYEFNQQFVNQKLEYQLNAFKERLRMQEQVLMKFEEEALANNDQMLKLVQEQLLNGDIDFFEWAIVMNQVIDLKKTYLDELSKWNDLVIELNYYSNN